MKKCYHIPSYLHWNIEPSNDERVRLQGVITSAIRRAIESAAGEASEVVVNDFELQKNARKFFSPSRYRPEHGTYIIPSYDDEGVDTEVQIDFSGEGEEITGESSLRVFGGPEEDRVINEKSLLEDELIAIPPDGWAIKVRSDRYVIAYDLRRAIQWGLFLFGARSFVILESGFGLKSAYYVLGTNKKVEAPGQLGPSKKIEGTDIPIWGIKMKYWEFPLRDTKGRPYYLRALFTVDGRPVFPGEETAKGYYADIEREAKDIPELGDVPGKLARSIVFGEIDRMIASGDIEAAAKRLAELDAHAFALMRWETKFRYLKVLINAWTREPQEIAIVEIIRSIESRSEIFAVMEMLRKAGIFTKLFDDLDSQIWSLLQVVGERFGEPMPLTLELLVQLLESVGLLRPDKILSLDELKEAAHSFIRFVLTSLEDILDLIAKPQMLVEGVEQLVKLSATMQRAMFGDPEAIKELESIISHMKKQAILALRGALFLGITDHMLRRIKWAIIWEVASWFIGLGELKAVLKTETIARIAKILKLIGRARKIEHITEKLQRLARVASRFSRFLKNEDEVLEMLSHLPKGDVERLVDALDAIEIDGAMDLAKLQSRLGNNASDTLRKAELLSEFAAKAGGLSDEVVWAFNRIASHGQLSADGLTAIVIVIPAGEGSRFAQVVGAIPGQFFHAGEAASVHFLRTLAESPARMKALMDVGSGVFVSMYNRSALKADTVDQYLNALANLERGFPANTRATEYRRLLDRLEAGDTRAWIELEDARRARFGGERLQGLPQVIVGNPRAEAGFERLLRGGHDDLLEELVEEILPGDPAHARLLFEQIGELSDNQVEGLAVINLLDETGDIGHRFTHNVFDIFTTYDRNWRNELLELTGQIHHFVDDGFDLALKRCFQGPGSNIQGLFGHLYAARTLQHQFPGARFRFELPGPKREIDIQVLWNGRRIDVEVKTNLGLEPSIIKSQIRKDLIRHIDDEFQDMRYLYALQQAGKLGKVMDAMIDALNHRTVRAELRRRGISSATAETRLRQRFVEGLVNTFDYH